MTTTQDPIAHAARLLREAAEELRQAHAYNNSEGWQNETDAKAAYDEHLAAAQALEDWEAAVGAGGVQALSAAPAGFVPVAAFDRLHAHAESLAARLLAASPTPPAEQQAAPKAAPQQEAQKPSNRDTVDVVGVRSNGEHINLGKIAMPPRMKAREIAIEQFGSFKDDDGSDAEMCFGALEYFLEWLIQQGWSKAPQPAPAPLSNDTERLEWLLWKLPGDALRYVVGELADTSSGAEFRAAIDAALAAQGGE